MATFTPPESLRAVLDAVVRIARERSGDVYVVGGTVRDVLLGREVRDLDLVVPADAFGFARRLADDLGGHFVAMHEEHAIARVALDGAPLRYVDVAQVQGGGLHDDLRRRDLTVNALAAPVGGTDVIDVTGGLDDLAARCLRMTSPDVFGDDPLRLLRAARIAAEIQFSIDPATEDGVRALAPRVLDSAPERIRDEMARIFALPWAYDGVRLLDRLSLLDVLLPGLAEGRGVAQPSNHHRFDVFEHNVRTVRALDAMLGEREPPGDDAWVWRALWSVFEESADSLRAYLREEMTEGRTRATILKLAGLLHDVAKPRTKTIAADGRIRFLGHAYEGATMASRVMRRYRFSSGECDFAARLVAEHLRPVQLAAPGEAPTSRAVYRFHRDLGDATPAVLLLALADAWAAHGEHTVKRRWVRQAAYMNSLLVRSQEQAAIVDAPRLLTGHDIMAEFGLRPGPEVGRLLEDLREAQATGEVRHREGALAFLRTRIGAAAGDRKDEGR